MGNGIEHGTVVTTVDAGLYQHHALNAQQLVQCTQSLCRRVRRGVCAFARIREAMAGSKNMAMGIASIRRNFKVGLAGVGVWGQDGGWGVLRCRHGEIDIVRWIAVELIVGFIVSECQLAL